MMNAECLKNPKSEFPNPKLQWPQVLEVQILRCLPPRSLRQPQHVGRRQTVSEGAEVAKSPHDFLIACDFEQLVVLGAGVAVADDDISAGERVQCRHPSQCDSGEFFLIDAP